MLMYRRLSRSSIRVISLMLALLLLLPNLTFASNGNSGDSNSGTDNKSYLIGLKEQASADQLITDKKLKDKKPKKLQKSNAISVELSASEAQDLAQDANVAFVEPDATVEIASNGQADKNNDAVKKMKASEQSVPWGIHSIGADLGDKKADGSKVKVAVLDTGIAVHNDLNVKSGVSFVPDIASYTDDHGHGTHVAGTIAALDNKTGVVGAAPKVDLYAVKVLDSHGAGSYSQVIQGIEWAMDQNVDIISMSFGGSAPSQALQETIQQAAAQGILIIAAAGNRGQGEETMLYPAMYPEVVSVGAVTPSHVRANYSSTGAELDIMAPGSDILSTTNDGAYGVMSGTSMATPHVTGAAAMLLSKNKKWTSEQIKSKLYETATPLGDAHDNGHGLLNVAKALGLTNEPIPPAAPPTTDPSSQPVQVIDDTFDVNTADVQLVELANKLQSLADYAKKYDSLPIAKEIEEKVEQLAEASTQLHSLPDNLKQSDKANPSATSQAVQSYFAAKKDDFKSLGNQYIEAIQQYSSMLITKQPDTAAAEAVEGQDANDQPSGANPLTPGTSFNGYMDTATDIDYHVFSTGAYGGTMTLTMTVPAGKDYDVAAYNSSLTQIGSSANGAGVSETITFSVSAYSTYYFKVYGYNGAYSTSSYYTMILSSLPSAPAGPPDTYEPNDSTNSAYSVTPGYSYTSYISTATDVDMYRFYTGSAANITITMSVPSGKDYDLQLLNASGSVVASSANGAGTAESLMASLTAGQYYYVRAYGFSGAYGTSTYTVSLGSLQPITVPPPAVPTGLSATATANSLTLSWSAVSGATSYAVSKNGVWLTDVTSTSYTFTGLAEATLYTLGVAAKNSGGTSNYATISSATSQTDSYEPNDTTANAKVVTEGSSYLSYISVAGDLDYYKFTAGATGTVNITMTVPASPDYDLAILNASGTQIAASTAGTGTNESVTFAVTSGQIYYIKVYGFSNGYGVGSYTLRVNNIVVTPPAAPTTASISATTTTITLYWGAVTGATSYTVSKNGVDIVTTTGTSYTLTGLSPNTTYTLGVAASNTGGKSAYYSISGTTQVLVAPITLSLNTPIDANLASGAYQTYKFTPATSGNYTIYTGPYGGTGANNDTVLDIYSDASLSARIGGNDDTVNNFSYVTLSLTAGTPYYVKLYYYNYGSAVHARLTAEKTMPATQTLSLNTPVDVNVPAQEYRGYKFTATTAGRYSFSTTYYGGTSANGMSDTKISLYNDSYFIGLIGTNDDIGDGSLFSRYSYDLTAGQTVYFKLYGYNNAAVSARLSVTPEVITFTSLSPNTMRDVSLASGANGYYTFVPSTSGLYRFFTSPYGGGSGSNDTVLSLYSNAALTTLLSSNDEAGGPYGSGFSMVQYSLSAGTTYYLKLSANNASVYTRLTNEIDTDWDRAHATVTDLDQIYTGTGYNISSPYDVDYYAVAITSLDDIHLNITSNKVILENASGTTLATFLPGDTTVYTPAATGTYYAKVVYDPAQGTAALSDVGALATQYYVSTKRITVNNKNFDATKGTSSGASIGFFYYSTHAATKVEFYKVTTISGTSYTTESKVYETSMGSLSGGSPAFHNYLWDGRVNKGSGLPRNSANDTASDGKYKVVVTPTDAPGSSHPAMGYLYVVNGPSTIIKVTGTLKPDLKETHLATVARTPYELGGFHVMIYDYDGGISAGERLDNGNVVTNSLGYFEAYVNNQLDEDGVDLYIRLEISDDYAIIYDASDIRTYTWSSAVKSNFVSSEANFGVLDTDDTFDNALNIWRWIKVGHDYYKNQTSVDLPPVSVLWKESVQNGSSVRDASPHVMEIDGGDHFDKSVILHEYGHYVMAVVADPVPGAGGRHSSVEAIASPETAYSEGWATYFMTQASGQEYYSDTNASNENWTYSIETVTRKYDTTVIPKGIQNEVSTAAVLLDLSDSHNDGEDQNVAVGFMPVRNVALERKINSENPAVNNIYEFYDTWFARGYTSTMKETVWKIFNSRSVAHDIQAPTVTITGTYPNYCASAVDDVGIQRVEWYIDDVKVSSANCIALTGLSVGLHTASVKAYDWEGAWNGGVDVRGGVAFGSASFTFYQSSTASVTDVDASNIGGSVVVIAQDETRNMSQSYQMLQSRVSGNENIVLQTEAELKMSQADAEYAVNVGEHSDLNVYVHISGPSNGVRVLSPNGELAWSGMTFSDEPIRIHNAVPGQWKVVVSPYSGLGENDVIPYALFATSNPASFITSIPALSNSSTITFAGAAGNNQQVVVQVDGQAAASLSSVDGQAVGTLELAEGPHQISYVVTEGNFMSLPTVYDIKVDRTGPQITLVDYDSDNIETTEDYIIINGLVDEDTTQLSINGFDFEKVGYTSKFGKQFSLSMGVNPFEIIAVDAAGNVTTRTVYVNRK